MPFAGNCQRILLEDRGDLMTPPINVRQRSFALAVPARRGLVGVSVIAILTLTGCASSQTAQGSPDASLAAVSSDPFASGVPSASPSQQSIPPAPGTLAGQAAESIALVVMTHNTLASFASSADLPAELLQAQARDTAKALRTAADDAASEYGSEGRRLAKLLRKYAALIKEVAESGSIRQDQVAELGELDDSWRRLLTDVGAAAGTDLNAAIPSLLAPLPAPRDSK